SGRAEGGGRNWAVLGEDGLVGEENARCLVANGTAVEQLPGLPVSVDRPIADYPRVEEVQALFARPPNGPIRVSYEHCLALMDGNLGWTDLNLERHNVLLNGSLSRSAVSFLTSATKREIPCFSVLRRQC